jgi:hypothetical protein
VPTTERPQGTGCAFLVAMDVHGTTPDNSFHTGSVAGGSPFSMVALTAEHASGRTAYIPWLGSDETASRFPGMERSRFTGRPERRV